MIKTVVAMLLTTLPIPFTIFGAGHFYLRQNLEGALFLMAGYVNLFLTFLYLPFEFDSLMGPNFLLIISQFNSDELMLPIITIIVWSGLISASIVRVVYLSKSKGLSIEQN